MNHGRTGTETAPAEEDVKRDRKLQVRALESGTVIDHLRPGTAFRAVRILGLDKDECTVLVGVHLASAKHEAKDLIKVEGRELTPGEINKIALISPEATLCIIRDFEVFHKTRPEIPDLIEALLRCVNPSCVSQDPRIHTRFRAESRKPLKLRCYYCERTFQQEELDFLES
jgi:aspartate carbamoyltransferase regulatory subunit